VPGFGVLVVIFLAGLALLGFGSSSESSTATFGTGFNLTSGPLGIKPVESDSFGSTYFVLGDVATEADNGTTMTLSRGEDGTVLLSRRPHVSGDAVRLDPVDDGQWTIHPVRTGTATITAAAASGTREFRLTVRVR
jgi:hypothetical protein